MDPISSCRISGGTEIAKKNTCNNKLSDYEKELQLTRNERKKKQIVEELLEEAYYYHSEVFEHICKELMIEDTQKEKQYEKILLLTEKGYTSIHDILYEELISKK